MINVTAKLNYYRVAPRKVRLVADLVRGKKVNDALAQLSVSTKKSAPSLVKLLSSAVSNAKNNFKIEDTKDLYIKEITVDEGPTLKRWMPRARGAAYTIRKRTSKINLVLSGEEGIKNKK